MRVGAQKLSWTWVVGLFVIAWLEGALYRRLAHGTWPDVEFTLMFAGSWFVTAFAIDRWSRRSPKAS